MYIRIALYCYEFYTIFYTTVTWHMCAEFAAFTISGIKSECLSVWSSLTANSLVTYQPQRIRLQSNVTGGIFLC